jgi:hypothetical protein
MLDLKFSRPASGCLAAARPATWRARAVRIGSWLAPTVLLIYLGYRLSEIGWAPIWQARPAGWLYYEVLIALFFVQPVADLLIYRNLWRRGGRLGLSVFLRKRLLNSLMFDYSGEAYLFAWANRHLDLSRAVLAHAIKDSNVLSAAAGLSTVGVMLLLVTLTGGATFHFPPQGQLRVYAPLVAVPLLVLCIVVLVGRRRVTILGGGQLATIFAIHLTRSLAGEGIQFALWSLSGAIASSAVCLDFVVLKLLISRLPIGPNKDLVFVGAAVAAAEMLSLPAPAVTAVLVTLTAGDYLLNLVLVGLPWLAAGLFAPSYAGGDRN